ncbi:hypothetical protein CRE_04218 [Caenorhabditis remanei]|uniref:Uncharacterized protein n=1 Tax=Caenorhabditis remanei TaxID=31234 RepID=E3MYS3_CAERE|nr:hypothetical protein CRE_04218 [Caenorhabditis remanei]
MSPSAVTSGFVTVIKPCLFHSFHPLGEDLSVQLPAVNEEKRSVGLDVFMDSDKFSLIVNKKHRLISNTTLFPWLPEDAEGSVWKCFGNNEDYKEGDAVAVKQEPRRQKENVDKDEKKNTVVKLTIYTPSSVSTKHYPVHPSKTAGKPAQCSKDQLEAAVNALSPVPLLIDTSVPPPSFLTPPTSGPASPTTTAEKPSFAFNVGVVNAPTAGVKVAKKHLMENDDAFEMIVDESRPKKVKIFSPEEIKKQESLVDEWKRMIQKSL